MTKCLCDSGLLCMLLPVSGMFLFLAYWLFCILQVSVSRLPFTLICKIYLFIWNMSAASLQKASALDQFRDSSPEFHPPRQSLALPSTFQACAGKLNWQQSNRCEGTWCWHRLTSVLRHHSLVMVSSLRLCTVVFTLFHSILTLVACTLLVFVIVYSLCFHLTCLFWLLLYTLLELRSVTDAWILNEWNLYIAFMLLLCPETRINKELRGKLFVNNSKFFWWTWQFDNWRKWEVHMPSGRGWVQVWVSPTRSLPWGAVRTRKSRKHPNKSLLLLCISLILSLPKYRRTS